MDEQIKIRLSGNGVKPGKIRSRDIAEILESVEDLVVAEAIRKNPSLNRDEIVVGIYAIEDESIGLKFKTTLAAFVIPAFISAVNAIDKNDFESLAPQTINSLKTISNFTKKYGCDAIIGSGTLNETTTITPATEIPQPTYIYGQTEILGKVIRVGGKSPKAMIELTDGSNLYCEVPEPIAKELGHQLYSLVRFSGYAKWNSKTLDLDEFTIISVKEFSNDPPELVFKELYALFGESFSAIENVEDFVSNLRHIGGDE